MKNQIDEKTRVKAVTIFECFSYMFVGLFLFLIIQAIIQHFTGRGFFHFQRSTSSGWFLQTLYWIGGGVLGIFTYLYGDDIRSSNETLPIMNDVDIYDISDMD